MSADVPRTPLSQHPFVAAMAEPHVARLAALARAVRFRRDQVIFREGDDSHDFCLIVRGRVALEMQEPDHVLRVQTLGAGDELGWSSVLRGRRKYFQARALEDTDALAFDGEALLTACQADTGFGFAFMHRMLGVVSERLQATQLQLHDMHSPRARRAGA